MHLSNTSGQVTAATKEQRDIELHFNPAGLSSINNDSSIIQRRISFKAKALQELHAGQVIIM